jgi:hypothetical protein
VRGKGYLAMVVIYVLKLYSGREGEFAIEKANPE